MTESLKAQSRRVDLDARVGATVEGLTEAGDWVTAGQVAERIAREDGEYWDGSHVNASLKRLAEAGRLARRRNPHAGARFQYRRRWVTDAYPAPTRRESSKPVPVGEPPTPEGAIKKAISELRDLVVDLNDGPWGPTTDPQVGIENVINFTLKPALEAAGGGGTGDRHLREALEWIEGFAIAGRDAEWDRVAGVARVALAASVGEGDE